MAPGPLEVGSGLRSGTAGSRGWVPGQGPGPAGLFPCHVLRRHLELLRLSVQPPTAELPHGPWGGILLHLPAAHLLVEVAVRVLDSCLLQQSPNGCPGKREKRREEESEPPPGRAPHGPLAEGSQRPPLSAAEAAKRSCLAWKAPRRLTGRLRGELLP